MISILHGSQNKISCNLHENMYTHKLFAHDFTPSMTQTFPCCKRVLSVDEKPRIKRVCVCVLAKHSNRITAVTCTHTQYCIFASKNPIFSLNIFTRSHLVNRMKTQISGHVLCLLICDANFRTSVHCVQSVYTFCSFILTPFSSICTQLGYFYVTYCVINACAHLIAISKILRRLANIFSIVE